MEQNSVFHNRYKFIRLLGRGNFSEVWLAQDTKTNIQVALKIYAPATGLDDNGLDVLSREFSLVVNANHENLLKPLHYDSWERKPYLVLPFCQQGSVVRKVNNFTESEAWQMLRDVAAGLVALHGMNPPIIHQDIKPDNILIADNGRFMITDFGVSTHVRSTLRRSMSQAFKSAGTVAYMAPERFGKDNTPIMANDIYSLGATVYELLTGQPPFGEDGGLMQKRGAEIPALPSGKYSAQLQKVITLCLLQDPWKRPTAEQLYKYASDAIEGKTIHFAGEKTLFQKMLIPLIVLVLAIIGGIIWMVADNNRKAALEAEQAELAQQAIYQTAATEYRNVVSRADSLLKIGHAHYENYELAYLAALDGYDRAGKMIGRLDPTSRIDSTWQARRDTVRSCLYKAYLSMIERADLFDDDPEMASEFQLRAKRIADKIDIARERELFNKQQVSETQE